MSLLLHWLNRLIYPVVPLPFVENIEHFLEIDYELKESTPFFLDNFVPMKTYYTSSPTRARLVFFGDRFTSID